MNRINLYILMAGAMLIALPSCAQETAPKKSDTYVVGSKQAGQTKEAPATETPKAAPTAETKKPAAEKKTAAPAKAAGKEDVVVIARVTEIPGKFPPNDLYNYVYVMKYRVLELVSGTLTEKDIYVGHYNPLIPRAQLKDKMAAKVKGNVEKFEVGGKHRLVLDKPIEKYWNDAKEDEYIDIDDSEKWFAKQADTVN